ASATDRGRRGASPRAPPGRLPCGPGSCPLSRSLWAASDASRPPQPRGPAVLPMPAKPESGGPITPARRPSARRTRQESAVRPRPHAAGRPAGDPGGPGGAGGSPRPRPPSIPRRRPRAAHLPMYTPQRREDDRQAAPAHAAGPASDLHDLRFLRRDQRVDLFREAVGQLLQLIHRPAAVVLGDLPALLQLLHLVLMIAADVADRDLAFFGVLADDLHQVPAALFRQSRNGKPDHRPVRRRGEPELALQDRL